MAHVEYVILTLLILAVIHESSQYKNACTGGFKAWGQRCYFFEFAIKPWAQAKLNCEYYGATLVSIRSAEENKMIADYVGAFSYDHCWIGLKKNGRDESPLEANYKWIDGTPRDLKNWAPGEPNDKARVADCGEMLVKGVNKGKWNDHRCEVSYYSVCAIDLVDGWVEYNGNEYYLSYKPDEISRSWYESRDWCMHNGGDLASVLSDEEVTKVAGLAITNNGFNGDLWIGLNKLAGRRDTWGWSDGSSFSSTWNNWKTPPVNDEYGYLCGYQLSNDKQGKWRNGHCDAKRGFICKRPKTKKPSPKTTPTTPRVEGYCPAGYSGAGNKCLKVFYPGHNLEAALSFEDALKKCHQEPGLLPSLASIESQLDQAFINAHLTKVRWGVWIGLRKEVNVNTWTWVDSSPFSYNNWGNGEPNQGDERCVEVRSSITALGKWNNIQCSDKRGYVCQTYKDQNDIIKTTSTPNVNFTCPAGFTPYWYACYKFQSQRYTYDQALSECTQNGEGATLAGIHAEAENAALQTIAATQKSSMWLGFRDRNNTDVGEYKWEDGWSVWFTMWGPGQPFKERDGGCVKMDEDGRWYDAICYQQLPSICKISKVGPFTTPSTREGKCPKGDWFEYNEHCYLYVHSSTNTWLKAKEDCQSKAFLGSLASIHSHAENQKIYDKIVQTNSYRKGVWIGLYRSQNDRTTTLWSDGSALQYENWAPGEPNGKESGEDCVEMWNNQWATKWNDHNCNDYKSYICKAPKTNFPSMETPTDSPYCPYGWKYSFRKCYYFQPDNWLTFSQAQQTCDGMEANLASVHDLYEMYYIDKGIQEYSNTPFKQNYFWIGMKGELHKDSSDFTGIWTDNTEVDYKSWEQGQPLWSNILQCGAVDVNSRKWETQRCDSDFGFVCGKPSNFTDGGDPSEKSPGDGLTGGAVAGVVIGCIIGVLLISLVVGALLMQKGVIENRLPASGIPGFGPSVAYQNQENSGKA